MLKASGRSAESSWTHGDAGRVLPRSREPWDDEAAAPAADRGEEHGRTSRRCGRRAARRPARSAGPARSAEGAPPRRPVALSGEPPGWILRHARRARARRAAGEFAGQGEGARSPCRALRSGPQAPAGVRAHRGRRPGEPRTRRHVPPAGRQLGGRPVPAARAAKQGRCCCSTSSRGSPTFSPR